KVNQKYIHYYNNERIQMKLKGLRPVQYRTQSLNETVLLFGVRSNLTAFLQIMKLLFA
ncbi:IS3 family transposase, partial [Actinobacillus pleuropneumoniae]|uniref:IS3 family transposase n=1 Tax=Actinobacillus pleuropneumoniae TaxID=715 RepID=UPI001ED937FC